MMLPLLQAILAQAAGPRRLGRLMSAVAVPALLAPILGPVIGGVILDGLSWRWIFFVNVPVCTIALVLAWRGMPELRERGEKRLDVLGVALLSPALAVIVYGLSEAGSQGGFAGSGVSVALAIGAALLAAFAAHALHTTVEPIIDLRLFRARSFTASAALMFTFGLSIFGAMLLLPLYYQQARGQSALDAGLALAPQGLGTMIALTIVGRLTDKIGPRPIVLVGMVLATLGTIPYALVGADTSTLALGASLIIRGAGLGAVIVPAMTAAYHDLRPEQIPRATSAMRIFQQIGASFGTAVLALILQHQTSNLAVAGPAGLATAFGHTFWWAVGFTALACIPALPQPPKPDRPAKRDGNPGTHNRQEAHMPAKPKAKPRRRASVARVAPALPDAHEAVCPRPTGLKRRSPGRA
jgi:EmrB/QacA subfamily drug resistance transporter